MKVIREVRETNVIVRCTGEQKDAWRRAAEASGKSVSDWIRDLADRAAKRAGAR